MTDPNVLEVDPAWRDAHLGATVGLIAFRGVSNPATHDRLNAIAAELEEGIRSRLGPADRETLRATPPLPAYAAYYKRWGQRYHVGMQLESVAQKGKSIPRVAALVEAMFIAELRNLLLTAGHGLDALELPVRLGVGASESFTAPNGAGAKRQARGHVHCRCKRASPLGDHHRTIRFCPHRAAYDLGTLLLLRAARSWCGGGLGASRRDRAQRADHCARRRDHRPGDRDGIVEGRIPELRMCTGQVR